MIVYFLRHASAGEPKKNDPAKDERRPLDEEGIGQCRQVGRALAAMDVQVDAIITSPLKRAAQTASLVGNELGFDGKMQKDDALRPDADFSAFRRLLAQNAKHDAFMVVGHNPTLSEFASLLMSDGRCDTAIDLKKGAVAKVDLSDHGRGALAWCLTPKAVRAIYESCTPKSRPKTSRK
jgi:phosphohistidine phosphatase